MKQSGILGVSILMLASFFAQAQTANEQPINKQQNPPIAKGYYSIGNNASKLSAGESIEIKEITNNQVSKKGYYSIGENGRKEKAMVIVEKQNRKTPQVRKGYYSIGNNAQKL